MDEFLTAEEPVTNIFHIGNLDGLKKMQPRTQSLAAYREILLFINLQLKNNVLVIRTLFCEGPGDGNYA